MAAFCPLLLFLGSGVPGVPVWPATSEGLKRPLNSWVMNAKEKSGARGRQIRMRLLKYTQGTWKKEEKKKALFDVDPVRRRCQIRNNLQDSRGEFLHTRALTYSYSVNVCSQLLIKGPADDSHIS